MKSLSITQEAYDRLKGLKDKNIRMSFTDVILMLTEKHDEKQL